MKTTEILTAASPASIPCYPARPADGGQLPYAARKIGEWFCEPKFNGWRVLVHCKSGAMFNRMGERLSIEHEFGPALKIIRDWPVEWLDCEALERRHGIGRGSLVILDYLPLRNPAESYFARRRYLSMCATVTGMAREEEDREVTECKDLNKPLAPGRVYLSPMYRWEDAPKDGGGHSAAQLYEILKRCNGPEGLNCEFYEGIVAKKANSLYPMQLRNPKQTTSAWIKHRWHF